MFMISIAVSTLYVFCIRNISEINISICSGKELYWRDENETPIERYQRLKLEIHELIDQVNNAKVKLVLNALILEY